MYVCMFTKSLSLLADVISKRQSPLINLKTSLFRRLEDFRVFLWKTI